MAHGEAHVHAPELNSCMQHVADATSFERRHAVHVLQVTNGLPGPGMMMHVIMCGSWDQIPCRVLDGSWSHAHYSTLVLIPSGLL